MPSKELWLPIMGHINSINGSMRGVHHYTSERGALGILNSGRMWFTEPAHLNDPSEISHGINIPKEILCKQRKEKDAARLEESATLIFRDFCFFSKRRAG